MLEGPILESPREKNVVGLWASYDSPSYTTMQDYTGNALASNPTSGGLIPINIMNTTSSGEVWSTSARTVSLQGTASTSGGVRLRR